MQQIPLENRYFELKSKIMNKIFPTNVTIRKEKGKSILHNKIMGHSAGRTRLPSLWFGRRGSAFYKKDVFAAQIKDHSSCVATKGGGIEDAIIYISSTHNNTIYTLVNAKGNIYCSVPTGVCGFKNARKSTSYASQAAAERLGALAKKYNIASVSIKMRGLGPGKLSGVRALQNSGFRCTQINECTPLAHNGCRPPKMRRI